MDIEQYVLDNFTTALENNYIQVYYQPVIRTMSRKLCSFEGLARWVDPELGVIRPDQFIPVLERVSKIHLLDRHVIREVCRLLRNTLDVGGIPIPVSINLSRLDFSLCDIFSFVNEEVSYYKIPRDFLYIEITESIMAEQTSTMIAAVNRFREAGYQVWMDDFGSAYSSLNVLKDFSFDEIKLDMRFLSSFNQRSRRILASVIQMAKEINICTLAEGVETEEQFEFLRDIGCEKVQGYYFGRPMPFKDIIVHLKELGIGIERPNERKYYSDIGKVNLLSAVPFMGEEERGLISSARDLNSIPLAVAEGYEDSFSILFYNTAFEKTVREAGYGANVFSLNRLGEKMPYSLLPVSVINLMDSTKVNGDGRMSFVSNEDYYEIQAKCIAHTKEVYCVLFRLDNISKGRGEDKRSTLDAGLKQIYSLFERITLINIREDSITPLYVTTRDDVVSGRVDIKALCREYAEKWIIKEDRAAYLEFSDISTLNERIKESNKLHISQYFRVYTRH
ncbi:MAG: EAL domain-containing protein, partial [Lachnospiraceae bacterium]|nr:EAL domain-containing protein [Lachnospiraceae bacterium]